MSNFNQAISIILQHEGHFVDDKADPGGATNYGISLRYLKSLTEQDPSLLALYDADDQGQIDITNIQDLTQQEAIEIYRTQWWDKNNYNSINDQSLATKIFDLAVNIGSTTANKLLQQSGNTIKGANILEIDGVIGQQTLAVINFLNPSSVLAELRNLAKNYYEELVIAHPIFNKFINGWLTRLMEP